MSVRVTFLWERGTRRTHRRTLHRECDEVRGQNSMFVCLESSIYYYALARATTPRRRMQQSEAMKSAMVEEGEVFLVAS